MKPRRLIALPILLGALSAAMILSCSLLEPSRYIPSFPAEPSSLTSDTGDEINHSNALFLADSEPDTLDPAKWSGSADEIVGDLFSGLVRLDTNLQVVPDLAESWDVSPDGKAYTFRLRRDVVFHSGRPFTANDVQFSWQRALDPAMGSHTASTYLGDILGAEAFREGDAREIEGVATLDDYTLTVRLDSPKAYFLAKLAYPTSWIVDRETVDQIEEHPVGTGPFQWLRRTPGREIVLERNPRYHLGPVALPYVVYLINPGYPIRLYEGGEIDFTYLPDDLLDRANDPSDTLYGQVYPITDLCTYYVALDASRPPFDDPAVRRAFALAVDNSRYNEVVYAGLMTPAAGIYPPGLPGFSEEAVGLSFNPEAARQALAGSAYAGPDGLPEILLTDNGAGADIDPSTAFLIQSWRETLGVTVRVEQLESFGYSDQIYSGNHGQIVPWGWCADYPDPENFADLLFHSRSRQNIGDYSNPALDRLLDQARSEQEVPARLALYRQAEQLLVDDAAAIFLVQSPTSHILVNPRITGYVATPIGVAQHMNLAIVQP